jgi:hypothetical protein
MKYKLNKLAIATDDVCEKAIEACKTFELGTLVNWADFGCISAEWYINDKGEEGHRVYIEEANPDNPEVKNFIEEELSFLGFKNIEVVFEW